MDRGNPRHFDGGEEVSDEQYARLCKALNKEDLLKFRTLEDRIKNREFINAELQKVFLDRERDYWVNLLGNADVPVALVLNLKEGFERYGKNLEVKYGDLIYIKFPINVNGSRSSAPKLGENTVEILMSLGYTKDEIIKLKEDGVISF
ncbi:CoA transferase [Sulfolobus tengchongensis]|uniref:CoA transferase n=1 Tax=Sulfolobus tengchongensis TaxID=207809 RepID=UPI003BAEC7FA